MTTPEAIARVEELGQSTYWTEEEISDARTLCPRLARELKEAREALEWQPIETAPKDGTTILVGWFVDESDRWVCVAALFGPINGQLLSVPGKYEIGPQATHWKSILAPLRPSPESTY